MQRYPQIVDGTHPLLKKGEDEVGVYRHNQRHAQQGNVMPEDYAGEDLQTHGVGAARPEDHDDHKRHEGADRLVVFARGDKGQKEEEVTEQGKYGKGTISSHCFRLLLPFCPNGGT